MYKKKLMQNRYLIFVFFFQKKKTVLAFNQLAFCNKAATIIRPENKEKSIHQRKSASLDQKSLEDGKIYNSTSKQCSNSAGKYYLKEKSLFISWKICLSVFSTTYILRNIPFFSKVIRNKIVLFCRKCTPRKRKKKTKATFGNQVKKNVKTPRT